MVSERPEGLCYEGPIAFHDEGNTAAQSPRDLAVRCPRFHRGLRPHNRGGRTHLVARCGHPRCGILRGICGTLRDPLDVWLVPGWSL